MINKRLTIYYVFIMAAMTTVIGLFPGHNGDMPFYIECALEKQGIPETAVRAETKMVLKQELPDAEYQVHASRVDEAAPEILDFYYVKPAYIWIVAGLHKLGFSFIFSTFLPSLISYFFIGGIVFAWALALMKPGQAMLISLGCMVTGPAIVIARLSSPDAVSNLVLLAVLYRLYFEKSRSITLILIFLSILVRIDNAVAAFVLLSGMIFWTSADSPNKLGRMDYLLLLAGMLLFTAGMNFMVEKDFWWFTKANYLHSGGNYFRQMAIYASVLCNSFLFPLLLLLVILSFVRPLNLRERGGWILLAIGCIFVLRCGLFPEFEERFFAAYYLATLLILAGRILKMSGP
jgi:hypothetical protein